jgi:dihydroxy-acid dehydratase
LIGLVEEGDLIKIDIPARSISLVVDDATLAKRREAMLARGAEAWKPARKRSRKVTMALKAYAALTARGAVRVVPE